MPTLDIIAPATESCIFQRPKRSKPQKLEVGAIEEGWRNMRPFFKTPIRNADQFLQPLGSLEGLDHFLARIERLQFLSDQQARDAATHTILVEQERELPTLIEEFKANGLGAISLSSSPSSDGDDDMDAANIAEAQERIGYLHITGENKSDPQAEHDAKRYGTPYLGVELAPVARRIEWERYALACSQPVRAQLTVANGQPSVISESKDTQLVATLGQKLFAACGSPDPQLIADMRAFAEHYGAVGSLFHTPQRHAESLEQSMDDLGADELMLPEEILQGPQELGMHWLTEDIEDAGYAPDLMVLPEPSEFDFWPALDEAV